MHVGQFALGCNRPRTQNTVLSEFHIVRNKKNDQNIGRSVLRPFFGSFVVNWKGAKKLAAFRLGYSESFMHTCACGYSYIGGFCSVLVPNGP